VDEQLDLAPELGENILGMVPKRPQTAPSEVLLALADVVMLLEPMLLRLWKSSNLTLGQLRVLRALREQPRTPGELAEIAGMTPPAMARTLSRLEERRLLKRATDLADRRRIAVSLTAKGREMANTARVFRASAFEPAAASLSDDERRVLLATLQRLIVMTHAHDRAARMAERPNGHAAAAANTARPPQLR
jgi:DNA-binding MarR family transcriptional regulator